jgi:restriction endonuclease S subunit
LLELLSIRAEEQKIANFLDHETAKIDTLIAKQQELIKLLKEKRQAVISHAVTKGLNPNAPMRDSGVEWLGEVPAHWGTGKCVIILFCLDLRFHRGFSTNEENPIVARNFGVSSLKWNETGIGKSRGWAR